MAPLENPNGRQLADTRSQDFHLHLAHHAFPWMHQIPTPEQPFRPPRTALTTSSVVWNLDVCQGPRAKGFLLYSVVLLGGGSLWKDASTLVVLHPSSCSVTLFCGTPRTWLPPFVRPRHRPNSNRANRAGTEVYETENKFILSFRMPMFLGRVPQCDRKMTHEFPFFAHRSTSRPLSSLVPVTSS